MPDVCLLVTDSRWLVTVGWSLMFVGWSLTVARQLKLLRSLVVEKQPTRSVEETNRYFVQVVPTAAKVWLSMGCGDRLMVFALLEP